MKRKRVCGMFEHFFLCHQNRFFKLGIGISIFRSIHSVDVLHGQDEVKLHVRNGTVIYFDVRQRGVALFALVLLDGRQIKFPMPVCDGYRIVREEWRAGASHRCEELAGHAADGEANREFPVSHLFV